MTMIERLIAAGMTQECAAETAMWFKAQGMTMALRLM